MNDTEGSPREVKLRETLVEKYWAPVYNRCLRLLDTPSLSQELTALCLATTLRRMLQEHQDDNALDQPPVSIKSLYRICTELCLKKISGDRRRNTDWLRTLESQKDPPQKNPPEDEQRRQNLLDLLEMSRPEARPFVLYRFIEHLDLATTAVLCNISEDEAKENEKKFLALANSYLEGRGLDPISAPEQNDCPDTYTMDRLMAEEESGLTEAKSHLENHEPCKKKFQSMLNEAESITKDLSGYLEDVSLAAIRLSDEKKFKAVHGAKKKHSFLPALLASLVVGALLWLLFPSNSYNKQDPSDFLGYRLMLLQDKKGTQKEILSGQSIQTGTNLGIMLSSPKPMSVRILSLKEKGYPQSVLPPYVFSWPINSSTPQKLPFSYKVDKKPGTERIFALFCPQEGMLKYLEQGLEFAYPKDTSGLRHLEADLQGAPPNCEMRSLLIRRTTPEISNQQ